MDVNQAAQVETENALMEKWHSFSFDWKN